MQETPFLLGFTSGELSPWLSSRFDLQAYHRGAACIRNFLVQPYGGVRRRRGTEWLHDGAVADAEAIRLLPFYFSESDMLMLEFFPGGMRVYRDGALLNGEDGTAYVLPIPWQDSASINSLHFLQMNDVIYVTCPHMPPYRLSRRANTDWTCEAVNFSNPPRETHVHKDSALRCYPEEEGKSALLVCDEAVFSAEQAGKDIVVAEADVPSRMLFLNDALKFSATTCPDLSAETVPVNTNISIKDSVSSRYHYFHCYREYDPSHFNGSQNPRDYPAFFSPGIFWLDDSGSPYEVVGDWEIVTSGTWNGQWELWRSYDTEASGDFYEWSWTCVRAFGQDEHYERNNWSLSGSEETPCRMVLVYKSGVDSSPGSFLHMKILGGVREYNFHLSEYISPTEVRVDIVSRYLGATPSFCTRRWSFGAFGARNGYPRFSAFYQGRLWLGGVDGMPSTLFASVTDDFHNFKTGSNADAALHLTLASDDQSRICWVCPARSLLVGTTDGEWTLSSSDGSALSATNASFARQSSVGSELKPASGVENTVFYLQRGGRRLREISYKLEADGFTSTDTSLLAEHLFRSGAQEWCVQRGTNTRLWALMNDGTMAVLTINAEQKVTAWQRCGFPGRRVYHLAACRSAAGEDDEVWFVLKNSVSAAVSIERLRTEQGIFLDGVVRVSSDNGLVEAGPHLAGMDGWLLPVTGGNAPLNVQFSSEGRVFLPEDFPDTEFLAGVTYESVLQTMPFESERSFNCIRQVGRVKLRLLECEPKFRYRSDHMLPWEIYDAARDNISAPFTGAIRLSHFPASGVGQGFCLSVDGTGDFCLLSMTVEVDYHAR